MANNLKHKPSSQSYIKLIPHPCYCGTTIKLWNGFIKPSLSAFKLLPGLIRCSKPFMVERTPHKNLSPHPFQLISQSLKLEKKNKATKFQYPRSLIKGHIRPLFLTKEISQHPMTPLLILLCFRPELLHSLNFMEIVHISLFRIPFLYFGPGRSLFSPNAFTLYKCPRTWYLVIPRVVYTMVYRTHKPTPIRSYVAPSSFSTLAIKIEFVPYSHLIKSSRIRINI